MIRTLARVPAQAGAAPPHQSDPAFGWGFVDASHVSRAFRARFGGTAGELRRTAAR